MNKSEKQVILNAIFDDPSVMYDLTEFQGLGTDIADMLDIDSRPGTGRHSGKTIYYITPLCKYESGKSDYQIYVEGGKSNPEEIVRQLWVWKLINYYGYAADQIRCEIEVWFGGSIGGKRADIAVYHDNTCSTVKILFEIKKPKRKDGIEQLKSYLGATGNPIGVWSNGADKLILYKPAGKEFDTLSEIPRINEDVSAVMSVKRTLAMLRTQFNFKKIIQDLEELVLADSGVDEFNEIFKLIYAKIYDEKQATEDSRRKGQVEFKKFEDSQLTYDCINALYHKASAEWPGVFEEPDIKLRKDHLQVCIGPLENIRLLGSNLRVMDDAFEYLMPTEAKKKKGQFFTPRHVIEMCVRMLNPKKYEYVIDPSCGSAGFLLHTMEWAMPAQTADEKELRKTRYAAKYLWGIDLEARAAKTSRALMLIAGDGHTNIFGPDVSSIDPRTWYNTKSGKLLIGELSKKAALIPNTIPDSETFTDEDKAWDYFSHLNFDLVLANPPFAGELKDKKMLCNYELAKPALDRAKNKQPKEERDVIFIERIINLLKPGGRAAIVLPQGKFNNSSLMFIRDFILRKTRLMAVVGLHGNTFKPHTGTKTSVLVIRKYTEAELANIERIREQIMLQCPDYEAQIQGLIDGAQDTVDIDESAIPEEILTVLNEVFPENEEADDDEAENTEDSQPRSLEEQLEEAEAALADLRQQKIDAEGRLQTLADSVEALKATQQTELGLIDNDTEKDKAQRAADKKALKAEHKEALKRLTDSNKAEEKRLKATVKELGKQIPMAEEALNTLTLKGRLRIILAMPDVIDRLRGRYVDSKVAKQLDYPIFMAVSERGGKDNSGNYTYMADANGNYIEDADGNPLIDQDLLNHDISRDELKAAAKDYATGGAFIADDKLCIAEAFIKFAIDNKFNFWKED